MYIKLFRPISAFLTTTIRPGRKPPAYKPTHGPNKSRYWCSKQILVTQKVPVTDVFPPFTGTFYGFFLSFFHDFHTPCRHLESGAIFYGGVF